MIECVLVVDVGTSKVHVNAISINDGKTLLNKILPYKWIHAAEGWSEADAQYEWEMAQNAVEEVVSNCKGKYEIMAIAFSHIGSGLLLMDRDGNPAGNMILAMDYRATEEVKQIFGEFNDEDSTILKYKAYAASLPPAKVLWLKKNKPDDFNKAVVIGNIQHFFNMKLGLGALTDLTIASGGGFYNTKNKSYDESLCNFIGFPKEKLGEEPLLADTIIGRIKKFGRVELGKELPVILGTHDCTSGMLGLGCIPGSDAVIANVTGTYDHIGCLGTTYDEAYLPFCGPVKDSYVFLTGAAVSGPNLDWFIKTFYPNEGLAAIDRLFNLYPLDGLNKVFLTKDINCGDGTIQGLNLTTTSGDLFKAIIEGLTFPLVSAVKALEIKNGGKYGCLRIGGGRRKIPTNRSTIEI